MAPHLRSAPATRGASALGSPAVGGCVRVQGLLVRTELGALVAGPVTFTIDPGTLTLLEGATPASRWAIAAALTGRLPLDRMQALGSLSVGGMTTPPLIRVVAVLAQSWRIHAVPDSSQRRLAALAWTRRTDANLIVLAPGLDGLTAEERILVLAGARELVDDGRTVVVTAPLGVIGAQEHTLADDTITLTTPTRGISVA